jgi:hypothetical protein
VPQQKKAEEEKAKPMTLSMHRDDANRIRHLARRAGLSISEYVRQAVDYFAGRHGQGP